MIRVTIDLHVVSKSESGGYWLSDLPRHEWENYKKSYTWCKNEAELRIELNQRHGFQFMLAQEHMPIHEVILDRVGFGAKTESVRSWPHKINIEEELNA